MSKLLRQYDSMIEAVLARAKASDHYVVMRWHHRDFYSLLYKNQAIDKLSFESDYGVGMYVFTKSGHVAFGSTNQLDDSVLQLFDDLAKVADSNQEAKLATAEQIFELAAQPNLGQDNLHYQTYDVTTIKPNKIAVQLGALENFAKKCDKNINTLLSFNCEVDTWRIVRSDGTDVDWCVPKSRLYMMLTLRGNQQTVNGSFRLIDTTPEDLLSSEANYTQRIGEMITMLQAQLGAVAMQPGHYPTIIDADLGGMVAHEALGHPAESDLVASRGSALGDAQGKFIAGTKIASDGVTIEDHEANLAHGFHPYGAFGNAREHVTIIKDGILRESISDVFTATKIGVPNKNCERSEAYYAPAIPRMSNTYVNMTRLEQLQHDPKSTLRDPQTLQASLAQAGAFQDHPKIIYLQQMTGGMVSPATGDFMFGTGFAYELSAKGVTPHKPVSFSGNVVEALKSLQYGMGDVQKDMAGFCGKSDQVAHVNTGGNALMFFTPTKSVSIA